MFFNLEPNHIIIVSHLSADFSISQKGLWEYRAYSRRYRNRRIGEFLKEMHLTEGRNTGFRKIRNALRNNGSPEPLFETDDERTYFSTTIYIHPDFEITASNEDVNEGVNEGVLDSLNKNEKAILKQLKESPTSTAVELAGKIGVSKSMVECALKRLKALKVISRTGSDKAGKWMILK